MTANLMSPLFEGIDVHELRLLLDNLVGGGRQIDEEGNSKTVYLPLAGPTCRVAARFRGGKLSALEPGPAFDANQWARIVDEIGKLSTGPQKVGREFTFNSSRVQGHWTGKRSGVQILPPPEGAPRAPVATADHPFILEFPLQTTDYDGISEYRRGREHRGLARLLNLLLAGHTTYQLQRSDRHVWAAVLREDGGADIKWVQPLFSAKLGERVIDAPSLPVAKPIEEISAAEYYAQRGLDGGDLRVPDDLDESISAYFRLDSTARNEFDRATYWLSMAYRQWPISVSLSFTALVSAVEALTGRGEKHQHSCPKCGAGCSHEVPGATEHFRAFFETHAPGAALAKRRSEMYSLRSDVLHGSTLLQLDHEPPFSLSLDPRVWGERDLQTELWDITHVAMRAWLKARAPA